MIANLELSKDIKVLNIGCGNSEFCESMYDDGFANIVNVDICDNVIKFMQERNLSRSEMLCKQTNINS